MLPAARATVFFIVVCIVSVHEETEEERRTFSGLYSCVFTFYLLPAP